jgi:hypothetical protein
MHSLLSRHHGKCFLEFIIARGSRIIYKILVLDFKLGSSSNGDINSRLVRSNFVTCKGNALQIASKYIGWPHIDLVTIFFQYIVYGINDFVHVETNTSVAKI